MKVNNLSLKQMGGQAQAQTVDPTVDPAIQQITEFITTSINDGGDPVEVVMSLVSQEVDQEVIAQALLTAGYQEVDIIALFEEVQKQSEPPAAPTTAEQTADPQEIARNQEIETQAQEDQAQEEAGSEQMPMAKGGRETDGRSSAYINNVVQRDDVLTRSPNYINPVAFESNDNFNIGQVATLLKDGADTFFGNEEDANGTKTGTFRDWKRKGALQKQNKGNYYNYEVDLDINDPNEYGFDNRDLFDASKMVDPKKLRDLKTYTNDVNENSRVNFNTETGEYDSIISSRPIDMDIYGEDVSRKGKVRREANPVLAGENLNYFNNVDQDTRSMIAGTADDPEGVTLGIGPNGEATSYATAEDNPYYYDTMMGRNTYDPAPVQSLLPPQQSTFLQNLVGQNSGMYKTYKHGGSLPKAQVGKGMYGPIEESDVEPFSPYLNNSTIGGTTLPPVTVTANGPSNQPSTPLTKMKPRSIQPVPQSFNMKTQQPVPQSNYNEPDVTRTNKLQGGLDRFMDSRGAKVYGDISEFAVAGAGVANNWFMDKKVNDAILDNREGVLADNLYAINEDPFLKNGAWGNGTFGREGQRTVRTNWGIAKSGKEIGSGTIDVDSTLLAKLIAAGADIEIL